ncbi:SURF1 family protein [Paracoccus sp. PAMC 22219]|uniref:SURF1 family protein n=1 Tax=Paracoccus sp. PAMC 22219 TaxID=1569209 RepID=UPI000AEF6BEC|nr:SURF1 family cytochrome oxidase biogenesis protein [Paracoccus sp. PAMC 22219]
MRWTQEDGAFLRANDPAGDRWFSRDTQAIAGATGLDPVAPWFLDLDRGPGQGAPIGGLTVVSFPNSHLSYALTWFAMAAGLAFLLFFIHRPTDH